MSRMERILDAANGIAMVVAEEKGRLFPQLSEIEFHKEMSRLFGGMLKGIPHNDSRSHAIMELAVLYQAEIMMSEDLGG